MGYFANLWAAVRNIGPFHPSSPASASVFGHGGHTSAGVQVSEWNALNYAAVWAATRILSEGVATLPIEIGEHDARDPRKVTPIPDHHLSNLLQFAPNDETESVTFRETLQGHVLNWGNCYAEIQRDGAGEPVALWQIEPHRVTPQRNKRKAIEYRVTGNGSDVAIPASRMFHVPGLGYDGLVGYSVVRMARESYGLGMATERYGASWFGNGARPGGVIEHPGQPTEDARTQSKESWERMHEGPHNANKVAVLWGGIKFNNTAGIIPPEDSQFLQTRRFQREEVALWFNIPPMKLGVQGAATFASAETFEINYVTHSLRPWLVRWESEYKRKLVKEEDWRRIRIMHVVDALLRGNIATRTNALQSQFLNGVINQDEWRFIEGRNPLPNGLGQVFYVPVNLQPVEKAMTGATGEEGPDQTTEAEPEAPPEPAPEPFDPASPPDPAEERKEQTRATAAAICTLVGKIYTRESRAAERAATNPDGFIDWVESFYSQYGEYLTGQLSSHYWLARSLGYMADYTFDEIVALWVHRSKQQMLEAAECQPVRLPFSVEEQTEFWRNQWSEVVTNQILGVYQNGSTTQHQGSSLGVDT